MSVHLHLQPQRQQAGGHNYPKENRCTGDLYSRTSKRHNLGFDAVTYRWYIPRPERVSHSTKEPQQPCATKRYLGRGELEGESSPHLPNAVNSTLPSCLSRRFEMAHCNFDDGDSGCSMPSTSGGFYGSPFLHQTLAVE